MRGSRRTFDSRSIATDSVLNFRVGEKYLSDQLVPAGTIEPIEDRHDLLTVFGIWIHVQNGLEQREVFGAKVFLQFVYLLGQILGFLAVFPLIN